MTDLGLAIKDADAKSASHNEKLDCAVKAVSLATDYDYNDVHWLFTKKGRKHRHRTQLITTKAVIHALYFRIEDVTEFFQAKTVRTLEREAKFIKGRFLVRVKGHILAMVDGKICDWSRGRCNRILEVYQLFEENTEFHEKNNPTG